MLSNGLDGAWVLFSSLSFRCVVALLFMRGRPRDLCVHLYKRRSADTHTKKAQRDQERKRERGGSVGGSEKGQMRETRQSANDFLVGSWGLLVYTAPTEPGRAGRITDGMTISYCEGFMPLR